MLKKITCKIIVRNNENQSRTFIPIKNKRNNSLSSKPSSIEKNITLNKKPIAFDKKYVWIPNIINATIPLLIATYFAALTPIDILKIAGNGKPCFCDIEPIILEKIMTKKPALNKDAKTNTKFRLYKRYNDATNEKPIML